MLREVSAGEVFDEPVITEDNVTTTCGVDSGYSCSHCAVCCCGVNGACIFAFVYTALCVVNYGKSVIGSEYIGNEDTVFCHIRESVFCCREIFCLRECHFLYVKLVPFVKSGSFTVRHEGEFLEGISDVANLECSNAPLVELELLSSLVYVCADLESGIYITKVFAGSAVCIVFDSYIRIEFTDKRCNSTVLENEVVSLSTCCCLRCVLCSRTCNEGSSLNFNIGKVGCVYKLSSSMNKVFESGNEITVGSK